MEDYYCKLIVTHPNLFNIINGYSNANIVYPLILSGHPQNYVKYLCDHMYDVISVRDYYTQITNKSHQLSLMTNKVYLDYCPIHLTTDHCTFPLSNRCLKCCLVVNIAQFYSEYYGREYFHQLYHHYYLFSQCNLLNDIKIYIRNIMFNN